MICSSFFFSTETPNPYDDPYLGFAESIDPQINRIWIATVKPADFVSTATTWSDPEIIATGASTTTGTNPTSQILPQNRLLFHHEDVPSLFYQLKFQYHQICWAR
jgi:hypothetical protein